MSKSSRNDAEHSREAARMERLSKSLGEQIARAQARGDHQAAQRHAVEKAAADDQAAWHRAYS